MTESYVFLRQVPDVAPGSTRLTTPCVAPASTIRCKAPVCVRVFFVGFNSPTHLDSPSQGGSRRRHSRGLISIPTEACFPRAMPSLTQTVFLLLIIAHSRHQCVCLPSVKSVMYHLCNADLFVLSWPSTILWLCSVCSTTMSVSSPCHPWMTLTCTSALSLHSIHHALDDLSTHHLVR